MNQLHLEIHREDSNHRQLRVLCHRAFMLGTLVCFGMALFSCAAKQSGDASSTSGNGNSANGVSVRLSDAPGSFDWFARADVTINGVAALVKNNGGGSESWVAVSSSRATINLLDLRGGLSLLLGNIDLPDGDISQLRLLVESASVTLKDGRVFPLTIPSGYESGLKIFLMPALSIVTGQAAELMLDFDVSNSFVALGNPRTMNDVRGFIFKPVIRVGNSTVHGSLAGEVYSDNCTPDDPSDDVPVENATVQAFNSAGTLEATNSSVANGAYAIYGLPEDSYSIQVSASGYAQGQVNQLSVYAGNNTNAGRITLAKSACSNAGSGTATSTGTSVSTDSGSSSAVATDTSVSSSTATTSSSSTDTSSSSSSSSGTSTSSGTASSTDTSVSSVTDTSTATQTVTATSTSTGTSVSNNTAWNVFGFDGTTDVTSIAAIWQTQVPTTAVLNIGLTPDNLSLLSVPVTQANVAQIVNVGGLNPNTVYYLQVIATDANGLSQSSVVIMKQTKPLP